MSTDGPQTAYGRRISSGEISADDSQDSVVRALQALHEKLNEHCLPASPLRRLLRLAAPNGSAKEPLKGLYIHGPPGRGKSMLMDLFYETAPIEKRRRVHVHPFMQEIHAQLHEWRTEGGGKQAEDPLPRLARKIAAESPLLCFDEFQVEAIADAMIVRRLFEAMFNFGVTVVATSNTAPDNLYEGGLQRSRFLPFIDLVKERMDVIELGGKTDYRRDRLKSVGVYHSPLNGESAAALEEAFIRLVDGVSGESCAITVQGRQILVPRQARGVAQFGFADLCEQPLGPADYWAVACQFQTIILSDIPQLTSNDRNAAKRFATLVETLYEQRTKLVCSAAVEPDEIYRDGDGAAIFERVASRLEEMQSESYLSEPHRPATSQAAA